VLSWEEALENKNKLQRSREAKHVNDILGLNYCSLSDQVKLVFLDTALYPYHGYAPLPWWSKGKRSDYDKFMGVMDFRSAWSVSIRCKDDGVCLSICLMIVALSTNEANLKNVCFMYFICIVI
jgi:hypothetical protein